MSGFGFSEAHEMLRNEVRNFARKELAPGAKKRAKQSSVPKDIIKKLANMGLLGLNLPTKYGGQPVDWVSVGVAMEELAKVEIALPMVLMQTIIVSQLLTDGAQRLQDEWIPGLISGDRIICVGLTEPTCGNDAANLQARAFRDGDYYILNGEKTSVTRAVQAEAAIIFAKTAPEAGARGVSYFFVPLNLPGVSRDRFEDMGWKPLERGSISMDSVRIPAEYRLGAEGKGFYKIMHEFDWTRSCLALQVLGAAQASLDEAIAYAKDRRAFGRPIAKFEGVALKFAEDATLIDAGRLLAYRALWLRDQGLPHTKETAMAKWWCPKVALDVIHHALLIHGHYGYAEELPIEQRLRDVIGYEIGDGTEEINKMIIAREILGKEFALFD